MVSVSQMRIPNQIIVNKEATGGSHAAIVIRAVEAAATSITSLPVSRAIGQACCNSFVKRSHVLSCPEVFTYH